MTPSTRSASAREDVRMSEDTEHRYNVMARTPEEFQRAYEHLANYGSSGSTRDMIEIAVCADCGWWGKWDSELHYEPGAGANIVCATGKHHLITRVLIKPMPPGS